MTVRKDGDLRAGAGERPDGPPRGGHGEPVGSSGAGSALPGRSKRRRPADARRLLISLTVAAIIPVLLFGAVAAYFAADAARKAARQGAADTLARVAERITAEIGKELDVAVTLAALPSLDQPELKRFYDEASRVAPSRPLWETLALADPTGTQRLNLLRPLGVTLGPVADRDSFETVLRTEKPAVGGIGPIGPVSGKRLVALSVPVIREGRLQLVLTVGISPSEVQTILLEAGAPDEWVGAVVDAHGHIIARTETGRDDIGQPASQALRQAITQAPGGFYSGRTLEGVEVETVYATLADTGGWSVHFGVPSEALNGPVTRSLLLLVVSCLASLGLAVGLAHLTTRDLAQRRRDQDERAALALAASEERGSVAIDGAELGTWRWDIEADEIVGSERTRALLDLPATGSGGPEPHWPAHLFLAAVHPDDSAHLEDAFRQCQQEGRPIDIDFRALQKDRSTRWVRATGRAPIPPNKDATLPEGRAVIHGVVADIEPRKRAEAERLELLRRLAEAQEDEQRRIARELHDQVGQTVTGLAFGLKSLEETLAAESTRGTLPDLHGRVRWLQELAAGIGRDIHRVAADLRPTALDDFGLVRAVSDLAADWSARYGIAADVQVSGLERRLAPEVETTVYRIIQEALTNVLKHASARIVSIVLERRGDRLRAVIEDDGRGFDPDNPTAADPGSGKEHPPQLGLSGIRERLALIGGTLRVESELETGTTLFVQIPLRTIRGRS